MSAQKNMACVVAFCDGNRGIANKGKLPWPFLKEDYDFYQEVLNTTKDPKKFNGVILGRGTWNPTNHIHPKRKNIVISTTLPKNSEGTWAVVESFDDAVKLCEADDIENIVISGGSKVFQTAIADPRCKRILGTRIFQDFPSDTFMPAFEHCFQKVSDPNIDDKIRENNGVKYRIEVWERK